jgi:hypothetical protein
MDNSKFVNELETSPIPEDLYALEFLVTKDKTTLTIEFPMRGSFNCYAEYSSDGEMKRTLLDKIMIDPKFIKEVLQIKETIDSIHL